MNKVLEKFEQLYRNFNLEDKELFYEVYHQDIEFKDPFHQIHGVDQLYDYFTRLMKNVAECEFDIKHIGQTDSENALVVWEMRLVHPSLNKGKAILVPGATHLKFDEKINIHRDYFDGYDMIYKYIPVLSSLLKIVKKKV